MRRPLARAVTCLILLVAARPARADLLTTFEASALIQSTASDVDVEFLGLLAQHGDVPVVSYASTSTTTAWSASLSGIYAGAGLSVSYSGDLSNYPAGAVTWSSAGTYGPAAWSGVGSATIADTSATTFQMTLSSSLTLGGGTASLAYVIPGTVLGDGTYMIGGPGDPEAGAGTLTLSGIPYINLIQLSYRTEGTIQQPGIVPVLSDVNRMGNAAGLLLNNLSIDIPFTNTEIIITGVIGSAVPEPSSVLMLSGGLLALVPLRLLRRRPSPR